MSLNAPSKAICTIRLVGWMASSLLVAVALGWMASQVSGIWSPMLIFPLLVGSLLGVMLVVLMRTSQVHSAWIVYPVAIAAVALVVCTQHWLAYRETLSAINEDIRLLQKAAAAYPDKHLGEIPTPPENLLAFMRDEAARERKIPTWLGEITLQDTSAWAFWSVDALLVLVPVLLLLWRGRARKWCPTCRSWYRVTRKGRLRVPDAERLLAILQKDQSVDDNETNSQDNQEDKAQRFATFILSDCEGHCGETEFAMLIPATSTFETFSLNGNQRRMVETFLDGES